MHNGSVDHVIPMYYKYYDQLLNVENLYNYIRVLQEQNGFAATTVANKLRRMQQAIEYTIVTENKDETNDSMFVRCQRVIKHLEKWRQSLRQDIAKQRMKQHLISEKEVENANDPLLFCNSVTLHKRVTDALTFSQVGPDYNIIISFLAANLIYPNAQRPGIVKNLTVSEFFDRKMIDRDKILIKVFQHKTIAAHGPASIIISKAIDNLLSQYHNGVRKGITPKPSMENRFFLTSSGNEFRKITETIQHVAKQFDLPMPTPCLFRKVIATAGQSSLDDQAMRSLSNHMSHSATTSARFYQFPGTKPAKTANIYDTIQKLSNQSKSSMRTILFLRRSQLRDYWER